MLFNGNKKASLLITNIGQLLTMRGAAPRLGAQMQELSIIKNAGIAAAGEEIIAIGPSDEVERRTPVSLGCRVIDAQGGVVTPGLIDSHTHPVFGKYRADEFEMRLQGKTYMEIAEAGGGIRSSVRDLRELSQDRLVLSTKKRFDRLLSHGVTTIEAKSGYGLTTEDELRSLRVFQKLRHHHPLEVIPTFLGAHDYPDEYTGDKAGYVKLLIHEMIPAVAGEKLAEFSDVFCEPGVFEKEESRAIQTAAQSAGLKLRFHADEFTPGGGAELAAEMGAVSADHLMHISRDGIKALAKSGTVAVLLPGTSYSLGAKKFAPARTMIEAGVAVALSTDCNPGSSCTESLPMIMSLATVHLKMTAAEAFLAVTVNAACALNRQERLGRIEPGMQADLVVWDIGDYRELPYHYGVNLARKVIKRGKLVVSQ